jgi:hypothetical protein
MPTTQSGRPVVTVAPIASPPLTSFQRFELAATLPSGIATITRSSSKGAQPSVTASGCAVVRPMAVSATADRTNQRI